MNNTGFYKVNGGYKRDIATHNYDGVSTHMYEFIPDMCVKSFDETTGTIEMYKPHYEELKETGAAVVGVNYYRYENEKPQTGADFTMEFSHDGEHYILQPLRDGLTLKGRGIRQRGAWYYVTENAFEKIKTQYKILKELNYD